MSETYDYQGVCIKKGNLVAYSAGTSTSMRKDRVRAVCYGHKLLLNDGSVRMGHEVIVLEEPIWPNK